MMGNAGVKKDTDAPMPVLWSSAAYVWPLNMLLHARKRKSCFRVWWEKYWLRSELPFPGNINPPNTDESPGIILTNAHSGNQFNALFFNPEISKEEEEEGKDEQSLVEEDKNQHCI